MEAGIILVREERVYLAYTSALLLTLKEGRIGAQTGLDLGGS